MGNNLIKFRHKVRYVHVNFHRIHANMEKFKANGKYDEWQFANSYYLLCTIILSPQEVKTE